MVSLRAVSQTLSYRSIRELTALSRCENNSNPTLGISLTHIDTRCNHIVKCSTYCGYALCTYLSFLCGIKGDASESPRPLMSVNVQAPATPRSPHMAWQVAEGRPTSGGAVVVARPQLFLHCGQGPRGCLTAYVGRYPTHRYLSKL